MIQVTVTAPYKKAVFTWVDDCSEFSYTAYGMDDNEIDMLIECKAAHGKDTAGYEVSITL